MTLIINNMMILLRKKEFQMNFPMNSIRYLNIKLIMDSNYYSKIRDLLLKNA